MHGRYVRGLPEERRQHAETVADVVQGQLVGRDHAVVDVPPVLQLLVGLRIPQSSLEEEAVELGLRQREGPLELDWVLRR